MEIKSRYEVVSDLENQKRGLIRERDGLKEILINKENELESIERQKADTLLLVDRRIADKKKEISDFDTLLLVDRRIADKKKEISDFKDSMEERKTTVNELIKSIDASLDRLSKLDVRGGK